MDSSKKGFLPLSPIQGRMSVEDVLHDLFAGITGLAPELVRPRWQPEPPNQPEATNQPEPPSLPDATVNWCAFGIMDRTPQNLPEIIHHGENGGHDEIIDFEQLDVLVSFYGPNAEDLARATRTGLYVPQNRAILRPNNLAFVKAVAITYVPEVVQYNWLARADLALVFTHRTARTYAVLNLEKSVGFIDTDRPAPQNLIVPIGCNGQQKGE